MGHSFINLLYVKTLLNLFQFALLIGDVCVLSVPQFKHFQAVCHQRQSRLNLDSIEYCMNWLIHYYIAVSLTAQSQACLLRSAVNTLQFNGTCS